MASTKSIKQPSAFDINPKSMHQQTHFNETKNIEWSQSVFFMHAEVHLQFLKDRNLWDCPTKELQRGKPSVLHTRELHNRVKILSVPKLCVIVNARTYTRTVKSSHRYTLAWRGNGKNDGRAIWYQPATFGAQMPTNSQLGEHENRLLKYPNTLGSLKITRRVYWISENLHLTFRNRLV